MVKIMGQKLESLPQLAFPLGCLHEVSLHPREDGYFPCRSGLRAVGSLGVHTCCPSGEVQPLVKILACWAGAGGRLCLCVQGPSHLSGRDKFISASASVSSLVMTPLVVSLEPNSTWLKKRGNLLAPLVDIVGIYWFQVQFDPALCGPSFWLFFGSVFHSVGFLGSSRYMSSSLWKFQQKKCFFPYCPNKGLIASE